MQIMKNRIIGLDNYKIGNKNNWRRWQWNKIAKIYPRNIKNAIVLYLPGKTDLDRQIAIEKGIRPYNLIAADLNKEIVIDFRKNNKNIIHGDIKDVLLYYNNLPKFDIVILDICSGFTKKTSYLIKSLFFSYYSLHETSVVSLNMLRGRDAYFNNLKNTFQDYVHLFSKEIPHIKHRSSISLLSMAYIIKEMCEDKKIEKHIDDFYIPHFHNSYKSGYQVFDSTIGIVKQIGFHINDLSKYPEIKSFRQRIAAMKAYRTMQINSCKKIRQVL